MKTLIILLVLLSSSLFAQNLKTNVLIQDSNNKETSSYIEYDIKILGDTTHFSTDKPDLSFYVITTDTIYYDDDDGEVVIETETTSSFNMIYLYKGKILDTVGIERADGIAYYYYFDDKYIDKKVKKI